MFSMIRKELIETKQFELLNESSLILDFLAHYNHSEQVQNKVKNSTRASVAADSAVKKMVTPV